jgi:hypothetical protein
MNPSTGNVVKDTQTKVLPKWPELLPCSKKGPRSLPNAQSWKWGNSSIRPLRGKFVSGYSSILPRQRRQISRRQNLTTLLWQRILLVILAIEGGTSHYFSLARAAAPQIVAGNVVLMKPAASVPHCSLLFLPVFGKMLELLLECSPL